MVVELPIEREAGMGHDGEMTIADRFAAYVGELTKVVGHSDRVGPLRDYCSGLLATEGRRSVEPMAAVTAPARVSAQHQKLLHFVANAAWSDERMLAKVRELVTPSIERHGPIEAWIIDDTSFPKKGRHSVGVHHQYCGQLGKQANCQVAVTLSIANHHASLPIAYQLYLPRAWTDDRSRREKAHVPATIRFKTKPQIALEQIRAALQANVAPGAVLIDASYGTNSGLRQGIAGLGLRYVAAIISTVKVRLVCEDNPKPRRVSVAALARSLPKHAWRTITWREGSNAKLRSRFARVRVRAAPMSGEARFAEETLLIEWPKDEAAPTKFWLATVDDNMSFRGLVDLAKLRWRIERDYQDLKQEIGLGDYEGRSWRGFHHHGTLSIAAYGFLISERERIPPSGADRPAQIEKSALPGSYRPRGAPDPAAAPRPQLDRHHPSLAGRRDCSDPSTMPMLQSSNAAEPATKFMIQ
jgi:SRSO17 transposase